MQKKADSGSPSLINKNTGISVGVVALLLSPLILAIIFIAVMNERVKNLEGNLNKLEVNVALLKVDGSDEVKLLQERIALLKVDGSDEFKLLQERIGYQLERLENKITAKSADRWTSADDFQYMSEFARVNNLKMPPHHRRTESD